MTVERKPLTTERQIELNRVIDECFDEFAKRQQHYYSLDGMSTAHITIHAIQDFTTLKAFWPKELVQQRYQQTIYMLDEGTMSKVQSSVRDTLEQLQKKGYLERVGNIHERRWLPVREKSEQVKKYYDEDGQLVVAKRIGGQWVIQ